MPHLIEETIDTNDEAFLYLNLHPGEQIQLIVRHHWAGFLGTLMLVLGMALVPILMIVAASLLDGLDIESIVPIVVLFISGFFIFLLTFLFGAWINFYYDIVFITNNRILNVDQKGLLARGTSELPLLQVQNVSAQVEGFLQTTFNYGTLIIETAGAGTSDDPHRPGLQGYFTIHDLPDPNRLARIIIEFHHKAEAEDEG
ncbi:MAG: PH domain-containing protein [Candidatus Berkelbacteria bacterium]|nr:MAG: PH domain-containing protein [Candidatus Berkelbacteria bacterium]QQG51863.1 MAG: PH domain-containing protein [Candidatus Berkelbacteria bacterium]